MTPASSRATASSRRTVSPQLERRRELRRRRRRQLQLQSWRVFLLVMLSAGLGWVLLRHGWTIEGINQVIVSGDSGLSRKQVVKAGGLSFPQPLLDISPAVLEQTLAKDLPVREVRVSRRLLPARLEIDLIKLIPVARAFRKRGSVTEQGLVDAEGQWIPVSSASPKPLTPILIRGWSVKQRPQVAELLRQHERLNDTLKTIHLQPGGAISLETTSLGRIELGRDAERLNDQIDAIVELNKKLPAHLLGRGKGAKGSLDLSNPDRPELLLPVKPSPKPKPTD